MMNRSVEESWNVYFLFASFAVSFAGAYTAIALCEQFRVCNRFRSSLVGARVALLFVAVAIGGGAIWSMHFVGMGSLHLKNSNGESISIKYDIGLTVMSLICAITCVYIGLLISTNDRVYSKDRNEIFAMLIHDAHEQSLQTIRNKHYLIRMALLKGVSPLAVGGVITGGGVCVMHYIGMRAMVADVHMTWDVGIVAASVLIAITASTAAFWILFRLLSLYPEYEWLRICSAIVMTIAVCGMHYTGMAAAKYEYDTSSSMKYTTGAAVEADVAVFIALTSGLAFCWLMTMLTQGDLRLWHLKLSETIRKTDAIFDDMRHVQYACNASFIGRYEFIKSCVYDGGGGSVLQSMSMDSEGRMRQARGKLQNLSGGRVLPAVDEEMGQSSNSSTNYVKAVVDPTGMYTHGDSVTRSEG